MTEQHPLVRLSADDDVGDIVESALGFLVEAPGVVSVPSLCNRLWFGAEYDTAPIGEILTVAHGYPAGHPRLGPQPALALGAIVTIDTGSDIAYGEVIWKEGAHLALAEEWAPGWLAGAPPVPETVATRPDYEAAREGDRVLRERVVLDFSCFGEMLAPSPSRLERMRERRYRLDAYGHLVMDARYPRGAEDDDVAYWASWVATTYPVALGALRIGPAELARAAARLSDALADRDELRAFGPYLVHQDTYAEVVAEDQKSSHSFARTAHSLTFTPRGDDRAWASMSVRLCETRPDLMVGTAWATSVVVASLYTLDLLAEEAPTGDWNGVHLRLDDAWQGGGLWRTEVLGLVGPIGVDPAIALGLGWIEHCGRTVEREAVVSPDALVEAPDWLTEEGEWEVSASEAIWRLHLTARDIDDERLRVPERIATLLAATLEVRGQDLLAVRILHVGQPPAHQWTNMRGNGAVRVAWPLGIRPGTTVTVAWPIESPALLVRTRLLAEPVEVGGVLFTHEFNEQVALAALGLGEGPARAVTLSQLVAAAVRRSGVITEDGRRALSIDEITERCFGPGGEVAPAYQDAVLRRAVVDTAYRLARIGAGALRGEFLVLDDTTPRYQRADNELLVRYVDRTNQRLRREVARHWRRAGIVNLPPGWRPSAHKRAEWGSVAGRDGLPDVELAEHQTWRKGHVAGSRLPTAVEETLRRAAAVTTRLLAQEADAASGGTSARADRWKPNPDPEDGDDG